MNRTIACVFLAGLLLAGASAHAAPLAKVPPLNATGKEMVSQAGMDFSKQVPDAAQVPFPAYPGSYFLRATMPQSPTQKMLTEIVLVSNDPVDKVQAWYAKHLKNMRYYKDIQAFAPPGFKDTFPALLRTPHVGLHAVTAKTVNATFFDLPAAKTKIWIDYFAKKTK